MEIFQEWGILPSTYGCFSWFLSWQWFFATAPLQFAATLLGYYLFQNNSIPLEAGFTAFGHAAKVA